MYPVGLGRGPETPGPGRSYKMAFTFNNRKDTQIDQNHANIKQKYINYSNVTCLSIYLCSDMRYCVFNEFTILILQRNLI